MRKQPSGYAPTYGDWRWQRLDAGGQVIEDGQVRCASCHSLPTPAAPAAPRFRLCRTVTAASDTRPDRTTDSALPRAIARRRRTSRNAEATSVAWPCCPPRHAVHPPAAASSPPRRCSAGAGAGVAALCLIPAGPAPAAGSSATSRRTRSTCRWPRPPRTCCSPWSGPAAGSSPSRPTCRSSTRARPTASAGWSRSTASPRWAWAATRCSRCCSPPPSPASVSTWDEVGTCKPIPDRRCRRPQAAVGGWSTLRHRPTPTPAAARRRRRVPRRRRPLRRRGHQVHQHDRPQAAARLADHEQVLRHAEAARASSRTTSGRTSTSSPSACCPTGASARSSRWSCASWAPAPACR